MLTYENNTCIVRMGLLIAMFMVQTAMSQLMGPDDPENICGTDDRVLSNDPAVCRLLRSGARPATAFLLPNGKLLGCHGRRA